ncbi:MAG: glycoside hydrolase family 66 protein [Acidimicrobiia bacterium]
MSRLRISPHKGTYLPSAPVRLNVSASGLSSTPVKATVSHLDRELAVLEGTLDHTGSTVLEWTSPDETPRGYGVDVTTRADDRLLTGSTAFDVLEHWTERPRYGFLSDFPPDRDAAAVLDALLPYHLNALQFYDWQFRHDQLVAPTTEYLDPFGRVLSLETIRRFIKEAGRRGMAAMAYAAVYAASLPFQMDHLSWALFDSEHQPHRFEDFLGYMNPSPGSPWVEHLIRQCWEALDQMGFDGIHLDQYGEPRKAFDATGAKVDLPASFAEFVDVLKMGRPKMPITLNAVKNWPIEQLARSREDFYYVEVWPDTPTYEDLGRIVREARFLSSGKGVVVAVYIPAEHRCNVRLTNAVIFTNGGSRIELGEQARLLVDPYFPNHAKLDENLATTLRGYWDLAVRYGDVLFSKLQDERHLEVDLPPGLVATVHQGGGRVGVSLVNLNPPSHARWDLPHPPPTPIEGLQLNLRTQFQVAGATWASADRRFPTVEKIAIEPTPDGFKATIPRLEYWGLLCLDSEELK